MAVRSASAASTQDRKSTRLNSSHTEIYTLSLHDALPISERRASPHREQRLDQRAALRLERVNGGPERLGGIDPGREQRRLAGTGLGGELLQPHRLRPDRVPLRLVPLDEV